LIYLARPAGFEPTTPWFVGGLTGIRWSLNQQLATLANRKPNLIQSHLRHIQCEFVTTPSQRPPTSCLHPVRFGLFETVALIEDHTACKTCCTPRRLSQCSREIRCRAARGRRDRFRRALRHDASAFVTGTRSQVDDPVRRRHHLHVVLDGNDGVARRHQALELRHQLVYIRGMQSGRGLVEDIQRIAATGTLQLGGEFDALGFRPLRAQWPAGRVASSPSRPPRAPPVSVPPAGRLRKMPQRCRPSWQARRRSYCRDSRSPASED